jgi:F420-non-reducing hydrogenase iron-sulfur subunit
MAGRRLKIVGFCCDKHGTDSIKLAARCGARYDASVRLVHVPCSGRVDGIHLLETLEKGADAVFVLGCLEKNCYYDTGSVEGRKRVEYVKGMLKEVGVEPDRVEMFNASSSMVWKFEDVVSRMIDVAKRLGPIGEGGGDAE